MLPVGHENAKPTSEICKALNLDKRNVNQIITSLRLEGTPIIGSSQPPYGLYIARNKMELDGFVKQEQNRANSTNRMIEELQKNLQKEYFKNV